jgi:hypothetical protein
MGKAASGSFQQITSDCRMGVSMRLIEFLVRSSPINALYNFFWSLPGKTEFLKYLQ